MLDPILQKLDLSGPNLGKQALTLCIILYVIVVVCTISSIAGQGFKSRTKLLWTATVVFVPFLGILCYLFACIYLMLRTHPSFERFTRPKRKGSSAATSVS